VWTDQETGGFVIDAVSQNTAAAMDLAANVHNSVG
jgi:hypothetical protein